MSDPRKNHVIILFFVLDLNVSYMLYCNQKICYTAITKLGNVRSLIWNFELHILTVST